MIAKPTLQMKQWQRQVQQQTAKTLCFIHFAIHMGGHWLRCTIGEEQQQVVSRPRSPTGFAISISAA
jgi:hypothetical protein